MWSVKDQLGLILHSKALIWAWGERGQCSEFEIKSEVLSWLEVSFNS
jgi:hypothetical protein